MMTFKVPPIGILQGRLTPSPDGSIQFFPTDNWENEFTIAHNLGFDCIELLVKKDGCANNPLLGLNGFVRTLALSNLFKVKIRSIHAFYDKSDFFTTVLRSVISAAYVVGAKTILLSFFHENILKNDDNKNEARRRIRSLLAYCEVFDVNLGIETELFAPELLEFINSINSRSVGVYYDIGNMASIGADVSAEILMLSHLICGVHVKDRMAGGGETVPLGQGCADLEGAFRALHTVGYQGPFILQGARSKTIDDITLNRRYLEYCRNLLLKTYKGGVHE